MKVTKDWRVCRSCGQKYWRPEIGWTAADERNCMECLIRIYAEYKATKREESLAKARP